jgi:secreted trypsin-like serine protease
VLILGIEATNRRLIIDGFPTSINPYPFVVSLMYCKPSSRGIACASICSGSLIAPDVVLTAGHCVYNSEESAFGYPVSSVPLTNMFVMVGSSDWKNLSNRGRLMKVLRVVNRGYGMNLRYPLDDDVGLVYLSECVATVPGQIETVRIAASPDLTRNDAGSCQYVTSLGFGRHANVPSEIYVHDGKLRVLEGDSIHSFSTCREAYVEAHAKYGWRRDVRDDVCESKHFCSGGDSVASQCYGDSGGPVIVRMSNNEPAIVGVVSFGPVGNCMVSPDYAARISTYASWIEENLQLSFCASRDVFIGTPAVAKPKIEKGRCPEWQCAKSGECIAYSAVCDHIRNCLDESDENPVYCRVAYIRNPFGKLAGQSKSESVVDEEEWGIPSSVEKELDQLIMKSFRGDSVKFSATGRTGTNKTVVVSMVGILESVDRQVRWTSSPHQSSKSLEIPVGIAAVCGDVLMAFRESLSKCRSPMEDLAYQVDYEVKYGYNRFEVDPAALLRKCDAVTSCIANPELELSLWIKLIAVCLVRDDSSATNHPAVEMFDFCGARLPRFLAMRADRVRYANDFPRRFGEPQCLAVQRERMSASDVSSERSASRLIGHVVAFIIAICIVISN